MAQSVKCLVLKNEDLIGRAWAGKRSQQEEWGLTVIKVHCIHECSSHRLKENIMLKNKVLWLDVINSNSWALRQVRSLVLLAIHSFFRFRERCCLKKLKMESDRER